MRPSARLLDTCGPPRPALRLALSLIASAACSPSAPSEPIAPPVRTAATAPHGVAAPPSAAPSAVALVEPVDGRCEELRRSRRTTWIAEPTGSGPYLSPRVSIPRVSAARSKQLKAALSLSFEIAPEGEGLLLVSKHAAAAALTPDGAFLITQDGDGPVEALGVDSTSRWRLHPWLESWHSNVGGAPGRLSILVPPTGDTLFVSCSADAGLEPLNGEKLVEQATGKTRAVVGPHRFVWDLAYSPDGARVLLVYQDDSYRESVLLIDATDGAQVPLDLRGRLRFTSDGRVVRDGGCPD